MKKDVFSEWFEKWRQYSSSYVVVLGRKSKWSRWFHWRSSLHGGAPGSSLGPGACPDRPGLHGAAEASPARTRGRGRGRTPCQRGPGKCGNAGWKLSVSVILFIKNGNPTRSGHFYTFGKWRSQMQLGKIINDTSDLDNFHINEFCEGR